MRRLWPAIVCATLGVLAIRASLADVGPIHLVCDSSCKPAERLKVEQAETIINAWRSKTCFTEVFASRGGKPKLVQTNGLTGQLVASDLSTRAITLKVRYYRSSKNVIGYRNKGSTTINLNRKYHDRYGPWSTASSAFHEASHAMGYTHDYRRTKRRPYSVPYQVNRAVEGCEKVAKGEKWTP